MSDALQRAERYSRIINEESRSDAAPARTSRSRSIMSASSAGWTGTKPNSGWYRSFDYAGNWSIEGWCPAA
jgi:hypothetical protein